MQFKNKFLFLLLMPFLLNNPIFGRPPNKKQFLPKEVLPTESLAQKLEKTKKKKWYRGKITPGFDKSGNRILIDRDFKALTFDELQHNKSVHEKRDKDNDTLCRLVERMIIVVRDEDLKKDPDIICKLRLELGDLYYDYGRYDKSEGCYKEFVKMYPGNDKAEYAAYKTILSKFNMSCAPQNSQEDTYEALKAAKEFLANNSYTQYTKDVNKMIELCTDKLLQHDLIIYNQYIFRGKIKSAETRLKNIKEKYLKNKKYAYLEADLNEQLKALKEKRKFKPSYSIDSIGQNKPQPVTSKKKYVERF